MGISKGFVSSNCYFKLIAHLVHTDGWLHHRLHGVGNGHDRYGFESIHILTPLVW